MRVFYFKSSDQTDVVRDEQGNPILDEADKPVTVGYYKIELKVAKRDCSIDLSTLERWSPLNLTMLHQDSQDINSAIKNEAIKYAKIVFEEAYERLQEKAQENKEEIPTE